MKRIQIITTCEATVTEAWTFDVADDFDMDAAEEAFDAYSFDAEADDMQFVDVTNVDVDNEREREFRKAVVVAVGDPLPEWVNHV